MKITKIELVVTIDELLTIERIAAELQESIDIRQYNEDDNKYEYLIVVTTTLFVTFVVLIKKEWRNG